jgi:hypothetical protein
MVGVCNFWHVEKARKDPFKHYSITKEGLGRKKTMRFGN